jgi:hypothetical protein
MINLLISVCGGLSLILRFLIPHIVRFFLKKRSDNVENVTTIETIQISMRSKLIELLN